MWERPNSQRRQKTRRAYPIVSQGPCKTIGAPKSGYSEKCSAPCPVFPTWIVGILFVTSVTCSRHWSQQECSEQRAKARIRSMAETQEFESRPPRRVFTQAICSLALVCGLLAVHAYIVPVQAQKMDSTRKALYKVSPHYPQDLKKNGIGGVVRLLLVISARGTVEKVSPIGGNAALVDAATLAVKQWKYAPADSATSTEVQFDFQPNQK